MSVPSVIGRWSGCTRTSWTTSRFCSNTVRPTPVQSIHALSTGGRQEPIQVRYGDAVSGQAGMVFSFRSERQGLGQGSTEVAFAFVPIRYNLLIVMLL